MTDREQAVHGTSSSRRYDLDALRAFAMLLGLAYHTGNSFVPGELTYWPVKDIRQSDIFLLFVEASHGFRMPLFFAISGFFTAMLWRKRGLRALLSHRFRRVLLPFLLGVVTILPVTHVVSIYATKSTLAKEKDTIWYAAKVGDVDALARHIESGAAVNEFDPNGLTPLIWATSAGQLSAMDFLLQNGANVHLRNEYGSTPLGIAAFYGRADAAQLLVEQGANIESATKTGQTAQDFLEMSWGMTTFVSWLRSVEIDKEQVKAERAKIAELFARVSSSREAASESPEESIGYIYIKTMLSMPVFTLPLLNLLWFLWYLYLMVIIFALCAVLASWLKWPGVPQWLILSPIRFLYLIPLIMIPQYIMDLMDTRFGADVYSGFLPMPHVLLYYCIFFGFGALYYDCDDRDGKVGKWWWLALPTGLFIVFPLGIELSTGIFGFSQVISDPSISRLIKIALEGTYTWVMIFAFMGLFRKFFSGENNTIRYLSDSSYWLYLAHLPLVTGAQWLVCDWPIFAAVKFTLICLVVTGVLLWLYQTVVRYTWVGKLLNGPRARLSQ